MASSDKLRKAVVAGSFYPACANELRNQISSFIGGQTIKKDALGCMLPHAGYTYSGRVAVETISRINIKDTLVLLGPNHTGKGTIASIITAGAWETPLGEVKIASALAKKIVSGSKYIKEDSLAHNSEHSLEVELPILQYFKNKFEIVPIAFMLDDLAVLKEIGEGIALAIKDNGKEDIQLLASSDLTHYEPLEEATAKDKAAIQAILELNPDKLMREIKRLNISMCGYAPVIVLLSAAKALGAKSAELIKYQTSADVTKDKSAVVGYAGITIN